MSGEAARAVVKEVEDLYDQAAEVFQRPFRTRADMARCMTLFELALDQCGRKLNPKYDRLALRVSLPLSQR